MGLVEGILFKTIVAMKRNTIVGACCALLILLFLYASIQKLGHWKLFLHDMNNQPLPHWLASFVIVFIPASEILISLLLIPDKTRLVGLWASLGLMTVFTSYTVLVLLNYFGTVFPCSCGGVIRKLNWSQHLVLNLAYVGIAITGIWALRRLRKEPTLNKTAHA